MRSLFPLKTALSPYLDSIAAFAPRGLPPLGDCFVATNAPRNDMRNGFDAGLSSYEKYLKALLLTRTPQIAKTVRKFARKWLGVK